MAQPATTCCCCGWTRVTTTAPTSPPRLLLLRRCCCCSLRSAASDLARAWRAWAWIITAALSWSVASNHDRRLPTPPLLLLARRLLSTAVMPALFSATARFAPAWRALDCMTTAARSCASPSSCCCRDDRRLLVRSGVSGTKIPFALEYSTPSAKHGWRWCTTGKDVGCGDGSGGAAAVAPSSAGIAGVWASSSGCARSEEGGEAPAAVSSIASSVTAASPSVCSPVGEVAVVVVAAAAAAVSAAVS
ncbi:unnamed protein product, partial [Ectocarpus sp. 12 AP-2014]